jgi:hypothetical protein
MRQPKRPDGAVLAEHRMLLAHALKAAGLDEVKQCQVLLDDPDRVTRAGGLQGDDAALDRA